MKGTVVGFRIGGSGQITAAWNLVQENVGTARRNMDVGHYSLFLLLLMLLCSLNAVLLCSLNAVVFCSLNAVLFL